MTPSAKNTPLTSLLIATVVIFAVIIFFGYQGPGWIKNSLCFTYLGCNAGFFGYDSLMHFSSGFMDVMILLWASRRFPRLSLFGGSFWKNLVITLSVVALVAVSWEILEYGHDFVRMQYFHENLIGEDRLDQPSNADTMGDITLSLVGALLVVAVPRLFKKNIFDLLR